MGFGVWNLGFGFWSLGFEVLGFELRLQGLGFCVLCFGFREEGSLEMDEVEI